MQSLKTVNTHPGVLGLLDLHDSLCPGQVIHLLKGLHFAQKRPLRGIVRAVHQRFAVPYRGAVYKASGAAGRVGRFESFGGRQGFGFCRRVLAARVLAARGTAWTRVVVSRGVVLPPWRLHLRQHFYLKDKLIWRRTAQPNWITGFPTTLLFLNHRWRPALDYILTTAFFTLSSMIPNTKPTNTTLPTTI